MRFAVCLFVVAGLTTPALAQKEFGFDNRKPSGQPYLTPAETVARMTVPPEFTVKLFAGEPQVVNPVAFTIDDRGRVWVLECFEYPSKTPVGQAPRDRIVILEDTTGNGVADTRTVFAEGKDFPVPAERRAENRGAFDLATGLEVGHGKVWLGAPPYLWTIDISGENQDRPGTFTPILSGFGSQDTHETLNTFTWGPDGYLYGMQGVFTESKVKPLDGPDTRMNAAVWRVHPRTKRFEIFAEGTSNPWGIDWRNTDGEFILACCVIPHLYHIVPGGIYKRQAGASFNPHSYGYIQEISDHTFHKESGWAHAGLLSLDAPHIPEKYRNSVIFGSIHGCSLKQNILSPKGSSYTARRGDDFLVSGDKNMRPINLKWGPHGDIYLIDWHDQNPCHQAAADSWDYSRGRVYRIEVTGRTGGKPANLGSLAGPELARAALAADPWTARTALRLVQERSGGVELPTLKPAEVNGPAAFRALTTAGLAPLSEAVVTAALANPDAAIRVATVRAIDAAAVPMPVLARLAATDPSPAVRRELAALALRLAPTQNVQSLLRPLMSRAADATDPLIPHLTWLAYEQVLSQKPAADAVDPTESELSWLAEHATENPFVRDQIVPKVMRRLVARGRPGDLDRCVAFVQTLLGVDPPTATRALAGLTQALDRQVVPPPAGWDTLQTRLAGTTDPELKRLSDKLAVNFRDPKVMAQALATATDTAADEAARAEAVRRIGSLKPDGASKLLVNLVQQPGPITVQVEAARALAAFDDADLAPALLADWAHRPAPVRADLVNTLAGRKPWAKELLRAMAAGTVERGEITDNTILKMQAFEDTELRELIESAWGRTRSTPADLLATIDTMRGHLGNAPASFPKGRAVFEANCAKCHQFEGVGQTVGPALDGAGRDMEYILANVIDPNRVIGAPYFLRIVNTIDGRVEQGILHAEDETSLTLKVENGVLKRIPKDDIDGEVRVVEKSMMPEGLTYGMSPQDFRDLVRYLMANPFLSTGVRDGRPFATPVTGRIASSGKPMTVMFQLTTAADLTTALLLGIDGPYVVKLNGAELARGTGTESVPDRVRVPIQIPAGEHTLTFEVTAAGGAMYARILDPDRKLSYPDPTPARPEKK